MTPGFVPDFDQICTPSMLDQSRRRRARSTEIRLSGLMRIVSRQRGSRTRWISSIARAWSVRFAAASSRSRSASLKRLAQIRHRFDQPAHLSDERLRLSRGEES